MSKCKIKTPVGRCENRASGVMSAYKTETKHPERGPWTIVARGEVAVCAKHRKRLLNGIVYGSIDDWTVAS